MDFFTSKNEVHRGRGRHVSGENEFSGWQPSAREQKDSALEHQPDLQHGASGGQLAPPL